MYMATRYTLCLKNIPDAFPITRESIIFGRNITKKAGN